ncbi:MAG: GAF domain-containing sensor histidine kinase [Actinomycetota bacterium]
MTQGTDATRAPEGVGASSGPSPEESAVYQQFQQAERGHEALLQAGVILASELSLPAVLQKIVDLACDVADARYGALGVLNHADQRSIVEFVTAGVTQEERRAIGHPPVGSGILGLLIRDARPLRLRRIQDHERSSGFPPLHPSMTSFLGVPIKVRGKVFGNLYLTEKRGADEFTEEDERAVLTLALQAGVAIENARLYEEARVRQRRLAAVNEVTGAILEGGDADAVLRLIARHARDLVGADLATVATPELDGETMVVRVAEGAHAEAVDGMRFPRDQSISGEVMQALSPRAVEDASVDTHTLQPMVRVGGLGPALFVPLAAGERRFGTLALANISGGSRFSPDDLALVELFAAQASVALEYARLREELQRLAVLEDRERIAKELHDGVVQSLFAVGMALQATEAVATDEAVVRQRLEAAVDDIDRVIRDLRNYIFALRPGGMVDWQLDRMLRELAEDFRQGERMVVSVDIDEDAASVLSSNAGDLMQAAREAMSNAVRHSDGSRVSLSLYHEFGCVVLQVEDDGTGFDPAAVAGTGHGLTNLGARASALGGSLRIDSAPGKGARVRITIPL